MCSATLRCFRPDLLIPGVQQHIHRVGDVMRTFVISLPESIDRRRNIERQLTGQDVPFFFYDAINLNCDRNRYFHHCDDARFLLTTGRTPTAGELGCYASHLMLWRTCRLLNEPLLILEDDAQLTDDFGATLAFVQRHISRFGFLRLQENRKRGRHNVLRQNRRKIDFCARYPHGSLAYAISPAVADAFISHSKVFRSPVDVFIKRFWEHGQPLYSLFPALAEVGQNSRYTSINGRHPQGPNATLALRRWWLKRRDFVARATFNVRWLQADRKRASIRLARQLRLVSYRNDG